MSSAKASGAEASSSSAKNRDHNQGRQDREYTPAQKAHVDRVRKCKHTAYYEILDIKIEATDGEVKKAYRKLALTMHPDKNGAPGADEAFKLVSKAFQVLSDTQKRAHFDRTGGDPDTRGAGGGGAPGGNPFAGFAGTPGRGGGGFGGDEISPEDLFNMFFGGNAFGGGGFGGGGTFFDLGGGPGIRIHQFGGPRPQRRRPRGLNDPEPEPRTLQQSLMQLLPLIVLFIFPLLSSLFSFDSSSSSSSDPFSGGRGPTIKFERSPPTYTHLRTTPNHKINYYLNPVEIAGWDTKKLGALDKRAESRYIKGLKAHCDWEYERKERKLQESQGWFFVDQDKARRAMEMELPSCQRLKDIGVV